MCQRGKKMTFDTGIAILQVFGVSMDPSDTW